MRRCFLILLVAVVLVGGCACRHAPKPADAATQRSEPDSEAGPTDGPSERVASDLTTHPSFVLPPSVCSEHQQEVRNRAERLQLPAGSVTYERAADALLWNGQIVFASGLPCPPDAIEDYIGMLEERHRREYGDAEDFEGRLLEVSQFLQLLSVVGGVISFEDRVEAFAERSSVGVRWMTQFLGNYSGLADVVDLESLAATYAEAPVVVTLGNSTDGEIPWAEFVTFPFAVGAFSPESGTVELAFEVPDDTRGGHLPFVHTIAAVPTPAFRDDLLAAERGDGLLVRAERRNDEIHVRRDPRTDARWQFTPQPFTSL